MFLTSCIENTPFGFCGVLIFSILAKLLSAVCILILSTASVGLILKGAGSLLPSLGVRLSFSWINLLYSSLFSNPEKTNPSKSRSIFCILCTFCSSVILLAGVLVDVGVLSEAASSASYLALTKVSNDASCLYEFAILITPVPVGVENLIPFDKVISILSFSFDI